MTSLHCAIIQCPYCWQQIEIVVDGSVDHQEYVEDCSVCCRPISIDALTAHGEVVSVEARSEDD